MSKSKTPREEYRSFTIRMPVSFYSETSVLALAEKVSLNEKINQLIRLGMNKHISLDAALKRLLLSNTIEEGLKNDG